MESLRANRMLMFAIGASGAIVVFLTSGAVPGLSQFFEIVDFPPSVSILCELIANFNTKFLFILNLQFRITLLTVLMLDIAGAYLLDRICSFLFGETRRKSKVLNC